MPTTRKRRTRNRREAYGEAERHQLLTGHSWILGEGYGSDVYPHRERLDREAARLDWEDHREELMAYWTQPIEQWKRDYPGGPDMENPEPGGPGTRPWGWWMFDAPEALRRILRWDHCGPTGVGEGGGDPRAFFGMYPLLMRGSPSYESEADYLRRYGLLTEEDIHYLEGGR